MTATPLWSLAALDPQDYQGSRGLLDPRVTKEMWALQDHQGSSHSTSSSWGLK